VARDAIGWLTTRVTDCAVATGRFDLLKYTYLNLAIFQPHPLGKIASHVYFSMLSLHLGVFRYQMGHMYMYSGYESDDERDELMKWHNKRSHDILITIMESDFGNRIQKLRIYAGSDGQTDTSGLQMGVLYFFI
jgi:hypothetical protein